MIGPSKMPHTNVTGACVHHDRTKQISSTSEVLASRATSGYLSISVQWTWHVHAYLSHAMH